MKVSVCKTCLAIAPYMDLRRCLSYFIYRLDIYLHYIIKDVYQHLYLLLHLQTLLCDSMNTISLHRGKDRGKRFSTQISSRKIYHMTYYAKMDVKHPVYSWPNRMQTMSVIKWSIVKAVITIHFYVVNCPYVSWQVWHGLCVNALHRIGVIYRSEMI